MNLLVIVLTPILLIVSSALSPCGAQEQMRPFWTEQSTFIQGEELFLVGIATNARTPEEGRRVAFENGKLELMNYAQLRSSDLKGLLIETQMTYEELNPDGSYNVFRLLKVALSSVQASQANRPPPSGAEGEKQSKVSRKGKISLWGGVLGGIIGAAATFGNPVGIAAGIAIGSGGAVLLAD